MNPIILNGFIFQLNNPVRRKRTQAETIKRLRAEMHFNLDRQVSIQSRHCEHKGHTISVGKTSENSRYLGKLKQSENWF